MFVDMNEDVNSKIVILFSFNYVIGRLSVLSTNTTNALSVANSKDITDMNISNIKDLKEFG